MHPVPVNDIHTAIFSVVPQVLWFVAQQAGHGLLAHSINIEVVSCQ